MSQTISTRHVLPADLARISTLHGRVFGPGRFARAAYRVREGKSLSSKFCRLAERDGRLIATLRLTEVAIGGLHGPALLGPLAVDPEFAGQGFGRRLVSEALEDMKAAGVSLVVLVGDEPYYGRFGFKPVRSPFLGPSIHNGFWPPNWCPARSDFIAGWSSPRHPARLANPDPARPPDSAKNLACR
jgi:predicted N-acetyltransferase YhbS